MQSAPADKQTYLEEVLRSLSGVVVAYSGGVDSTFLAATAHRVLGDRSVAITAASPAMATREVRAARALALDRGWNHRTVRTEEVRREEYAVNGADRCYWCKTELFDVLEPIARRMDATIALGTTVDDLDDFRPGLVAARDRDVAAPLVDAELSKDEVRQLSRLLDLPTADKPATPCLASRVAYGVRVTPERLRRVDRAERFLHDLGFATVRVRDHGDLARIEVPQADIDRLAAMRGRVADELGSLGFSYVTIDLDGFRSGSLNAVVTMPSVRKDG